MASIEECEAAFAKLAQLLGGMDEGQRRKVVLDRTVSAKIKDLDVMFAGALRDGGLHDVHRVAPEPRQHDPAQIKLALSSDDLVKLTAGELNFAAAWATGRLKVDASVFDLLKLRSLF
ncbi:SCP-2 sterol transfer family protein [Frankineae bacterium MT45]|nr:SCP-2 sterol transfer family protein [Frankineae bacterium MT45]